MAEWIPEGWRTVTPRLVVSDPAKLVQFLREAFGATGEYRTDAPSQIRIGDSLVMVSAAGVREAMPGFLYVYVEDADATYRRALEAGAHSVEEPVDVPYGDRRGMVRDSFGNIWQIATHLRKDLVDRVTLDLGARKRERNSVREVLTSIEKEYRRYKKLAESAFEQVTDAELVAIPTREGNSIIMLAWHLSGNLKSRFTDFLTADGEKPWRDRESEFEAREVRREQLLAKWEEGWSVLFRALSDLNDDALVRRVTIRGEEHTVLQALHRSLAHASYHVGQVVYVAKSFRGEAWRSLSIPKGGLMR